MTFMASKGIEGVRVKRDRLLAETDYKVAPDSPLSEGWRLAWGEYRQKLRDVTNQALPVTWPAEPTEPVEIIPEVDAEIEYYRKDGETDAEMKGRLLDDIAKLQSRQASPQGAKPEDIELFKTLHRIQFRLNEI